MYSAIWQKNTKWSANNDNLYINAPAHIFLWIYLYIYINWIEALLREYWCAPATKITGAMSNQRLSKYLLMPFMIYSCHWHSGHCMSFQAWCCLWNLHVVAACSIIIFFFCYCDTTERMSKWVSVWVRERDVDLPNNMNITNADDEQWECVCI